MESSNVLRLSQKTINAIGKVISGESFYNEQSEMDLVSSHDPDPFYLDAQYRAGQLSPRIGQSEQLALFVDLGLDDSSMLDRSSSFRTMDEIFYVEKCLRNIKSVEKLSSLITRIFHPIRFLDTPFSPEPGIQKLNEYFCLENLEIYSLKSTGILSFKVRRLNGAQVRAEFTEKRLHPLSHEFIFEQIQKCDNKLAQNDYTGAITNSRTLLEEILKAIQNELEHNPNDYPGDMMRLYKDVQRLLNLDPAQHDVAALKQLLSGLTSILNALASLRNSTGDAHALRFRPQQHHAQLAVNAAKTIADFLFQTFEYQLANGSIQLKKTLSSSAS